MSTYLEMKLNELVMEVAYAIEDPCGAEAIKLARALIELGRSVPAARRMGIIAWCNISRASFERRPELYRDPRGLLSCAPDFPPQSPEHAALGRTVAHAMMAFSHPGGTAGWFSEEMMKESRARRWKALAKKLLRRIREERAQRIFEDLEGSCEPGDLVDD